MNGTTIKKIGSIFSLLTFFITSPEEKSWSHILAQHNQTSYIAGALATSIIVGALSYNYYQKNILSLENFIENNDFIYKKIYQDAHRYHNFYQSDAQISDWDLKEIILYNNRETYPFMRYYSSLMQTSLILYRHILTLDKQLMEIHQYKYKLSYQKQSAHIEQLQKTLEQIESNEKNLRNFIVTIITVIIVLKNKIKLFKEYHDDYNAWIQTQNNVTN